MSSIEVKIMIEKDIARAYLKNKDFEHSMRVVELCKNFANKLAMTNSKLIERAAWLHDIGKIINNDKHAKKEVIIEALINCYYKPDDFKELVFIIQNHKGKFQPKKLELECSILRICDKLDKFEKEKLEIIETCEKNMDKIRKILAESPNDLNKFEKIYADLMKNILLNFPELNL